MMDYCRECGVNFFDTAEIYPVKPSAATQGATSRIVGSWLKGKPRSEVMIASKVAGRSVGMPWVPANRTDPPVQQGQAWRGTTAGAEKTPVVSGAAIRAACEGELRRLDTDYLDLFHIHWPDRYVPLFGLSQYHVRSERDAVPFQEQVEAMGQLIAEGKVRYWGLSNETTFGATTFCATAAALGVPQPVSIQNSYSLIHRSFEEQLAEACSPQNLNLGLLPWSAMAGGALSGKYLGGEQPDGTRMTRWPDRYKRFITPRVFEAVAEYARIAEQAGLTPAQLAYAFCRSRWFVPTTLMGATTMEQLRENLLAFSSPLGDDVLAAIDEVHVRNRNPVRRAARIPEEGRWIDAHKYIQKPNAAPGSSLPVVRLDDEGQRFVHTMKWGLIPSYSRPEERPNYFRMFNARSETVGTKGVFKRLLKTSRCVIVANGFYEWKTEGAGRMETKQPYYVHFDGERPMCFAGLFDRWRQKGEDGEMGEVFSTTILTTSSSERFSWLHDRMPVLLPDERAADEWLRGGSCSGEVAQDASAVVDTLVGLAEPHKGPDLTWHAVTPAMNRMSYQGDDCAKPLRRPSLTTFFVKRARPSQEEEGERAEPPAPSKRQQRAESGGGADAAQEVERGAEEGAPPADALRDEDAESAADLAAPEAQSEAGGVSKLRDGAADASKLPMEPCSASPASSAAAGLAPAPQAQPSPAPPARGSTQLRHSAASTLRSSPLPAAARRSAAAKLQPTLKQFFKRLS